MSNIAIFKNAGDIVPIQPEGLSDLGQSISRPSRTTRRIQTNTNGTFRRVVNGQQVGKPVRGEFNAIIVAMLPNVSRTFYKAEFDPNAKATLPDCWSNLGDLPDTKAANKQGSSCANCPKNVVGSGKNGKGRACRYERRIALLLEGDASGDVYQFKIPAGSLFGDGHLHTHPFEGYAKYLVNNGFSPDYVVTNVAYDLESDTMKLKFTPGRPITQEELMLVKTAQADPDTKQLIRLTVGEADKADPPKAEEAKPKVADWGADEEEEDEVEVVVQAPKPKKATPQEVLWGDDAEEAEFTEVSEEAPATPVKRTAKKAAAPVGKADLASVVSEWAEDE
jgi:hypothetical protein